MMRTILQISRGAVFGTGAIVAGMYAVWAAMNGSWAMMTGLNKAYEVEETRPWWKVLCVMFGLTISLAILGPIALAAIVYGNRVWEIISHPLGVPAHFEFLWRTIPWAAVVILLLFSFAAFYRFGPNFRPPDIAPFQNVRFQGGQGAEAMLRWAGVPGKASPISGGGRTAKRRRSRVPGKTVAV
jgi:uncharacterized BrkB/YihY/UPF0761 family membrane protein